MESSALAPSCFAPVAPQMAAIASTPPAPTIVAAPEIASADGISQKDRQVALSRHALLKAHEDYRLTHPEMSRARSDAEFLSGYSAGALFPHLLGVLGEVSRGTLYRWRQMLDGTEDWARLAPQYSRASAPRLSKAEEKIFLGLLLNGNKMLVGTAIKFTKHQLRVHGIPCTKSDMTFRRFADEFRAAKFDTWTLMREGQKALRDKVAPYIKRDPSVLDVGDVFVADGHVLNFQVINPFTGKPCRPTLLAYIDWKSNDLAGYEIMVSENTQAIASALRNSIIRLGKMPRISLQDNGRAFRAKFFTGCPSFEEAGLGGLFGRLGISPMFATPYNARAKVIERWFKEFSNTFERLVPSFIGSSIVDKPAYMMRNEKFHRALHKKYVPTIEEAIEYIEMWLGWYRTTECSRVRGSSIADVWGAGVGPGVDIDVLDDLMMDMKITRIDRNGIRFLNQDYYDENLYGLSGKNELVIIRYSLSDLSYIKVYTMAGEFMCTAPRVMAVHPMARLMGTPKDMQELTRGMKLQRGLEKKTISGAKGLLQLGAAAELDWQRVAEVSPRVIDTCEREGISLPAPDVSIPEECVEERAAAEIVRLEPSGRPQFEDEIERYEWHIEHGILNEEDEAFCVYFRTTNQFRMLFEQAAAIHE